ncbi:MAG TPA: ABC transporter ATP-binding protein [Candidatus Pullichristensenella excrementigallinarum]|uniref:ABC transporter ATP-binding protein n=1 Tax=Candidatus Pullichristensenella excrementigallinarum TaxID=2840907 RepID=A0A9D1LCN7_9FIRM|nr:ABC transporter ATP-binding protein [Candidatus Pullichristensenella excrementigallinarum]
MDKQNQAQKKGVRIDHISKIYKDPKTGRDFYAVKDISVDIAPGTFVTLLGPSGCGKTTTLRMIAGFESPDLGEIYLGGEPINELTPNKRDTAMVFQTYALFPHYNVFDNVAYGLRLRKMPKPEIEKQVKRILDLVELNGMESRMPNQLSGGQQQRVALARALVVEPGVLLFDEPLSNLDAKLRVSMRTEIRRIQQALGITAIYVTHDQSEAMSISDDIIIMNQGVIEQIGSPMEIYYHPKSEFVADFIGEANFLEGVIAEVSGKECVMEVYGQRLHLLNPDNFPVGKASKIVLRPEAARIGDSGMLKCKVTLSCFMGSYQNYHVMVGDTMIKITDFCPINKKTYQVGDEAYLSFDADCVHIL